MYLRLFVLFFSIGFLAVGCKPAHKKGHKKHHQMKKSEKKMKKSSSASADEAMMAMVCKSGKDERNIQVRKPEAGGCEVVYTKFGEESVVADAKYDMNFCKEKAEKVKSNLVAAGFECSDAS